MKIPEISLFVPFLLNRTDLYIPLLLFNYLLRDEKLFLFMATHAECEAIVDLVSATALISV